MAAVLGILVMMGCGSESESREPLETDSGADARPLGGCEGRAWGDPCVTSQVGEWNGAGKTLVLFCNPDTKSCAPKCEDGVHTVTAGECADLGGTCLYRSDYGEQCVAP